MKLTELAESIAIKYNRNDYEFKEMLKSDIISARATIIKREFEKTNIFNSVLIQTLDCVSLIKVNSVQCSVNVNSDTILRSKNKLPKPLLLKDSTLFISVTTPFLNKKRINLTVIKPEEVEFITYRRFTNNECYVTYENDYLYIHNHKDLPFITIRDVFANPLEVKAFKELSKEDSNCKCDTCNESEDLCFEDDDLIIDETLSEGIKSFIYNELNKYRPTDSEIKI